MGADPSWWSTFFTGLGASVVGRLHNPAQTRLEADFIQRELGLAHGSAVADIPCGDGRLALELARRGFQMRGVDISSELIREARNSERASGLVANFEEGDMKEIAWRGELAGAFCFGNSFAYFDDAGNRQFLERVYRALRVGGRFALQTGVIAESIFTKPLSRAWYELGDILFLHSARYEPESSRLISDYRLIRGQECERKVAIYRVYTLSQLLELFEDAGFHSIRALGDLQPGAAFRLGDPTLYVVAEK